LRAQLLAAQRGAALEKARRELSSTSRALEAAGAAHARTARDAAGVYQRVSELEAGFGPMLVPQRRAATADPRTRDSRPGTRGSSTRPSTRGSLPAMWSSSQTMTPMSMSRPGTRGSSAGGGAGGLLVRALPSSAAASAPRLLTPSEAVQLATHPLLDAKVASDPRLRALQSSASSRGASRDGGIPQPGMGSLGLDDIPRVGWPAGPSRPSTRGSLGGHLEAPPDAFSAADPERSPPRSHSLSMWARDVQQQAASQHTPQLA